MSTRSRIQELANNSEIENSRNKSLAKISELTVVLDYFATKINDKTNTAFTLHLRCILIDWTFMRQIREFRSNFENIPRDCREIF